ncbi:hypothetical protein [Massilia sp. 9096]|uniref:hypothetical protein n=1 Tax=Massilia sp. 9096 TaxID=1500894 RepID=UPI000689EFE3|nr:hypothetical protein [Massilia sp. 9096]
MSRPAPYLTQRFGRMTRLVVWFASLVLVLQLLGATQHRHDITHTASDCAACVLAGQPPSPPSPPVIPQPPVSEASFHYVLARSNPIAPPRSASFLIPHAHAPPAVFM